MEMDGVGIPLSAYEVVLQVSFVYLYRVPADSIRYCTLYGGVQVRSGQVVGELTPYP